MSMQLLWVNPGETITNKTSNEEFVVEEQNHTGRVDIRSVMKGDKFSIFPYTDFWRLSQPTGWDIGETVKEPTPPPVDMVNEPPHYKRGGYEVIDVLAAFFPDNPLLWQVGKYIMRAGHKADTVEDLKKAEFYLKREIARLEDL